MSKSLGLFHEIESVKTNMSNLPQFKYEKDNRNKVDRIGVRRVLSFYCGT